MQINSSSDNNSAQNEFNDFPLASPWIRLGAYTIDAIILLTITIPLLIFTGLFDEMGGGMTFVTEIIAASIMFSVYVLINVWLIFSKSQTIGKSILKIQVVDKNTRMPIGGIRYIFARTLPVWIWSQIPYIEIIMNLIDCLLIFREEHNCLHDDIAGTRVIKLGSKK